MIVGCSFLLVFFGSVAQRCVDAGPQTGARTWSPRPNMLQNLIIEVPGVDEKNEKKLHTFRFAMLMIGSESVGGRDCWKAAFIPGDQTPEASKKRFEILVDKQTGCPRKITAVKAESSARIEKVGDMTLTVDSPENIPFDFLPLSSAKEFSEGSVLVKLQSTTVDKDTVLDLAYLIEGKEKLRIRQRWVQGEDWWRYYDRHVMALW